MRETTTPLRLALTGFAAMRVAAFELFEQIGEGLLRLFLRHHWSGRHHLRWGQRACGVCGGWLGDSFRDGRRHDFFGDGRRHGLGSGFCGCFGRGNFNGRGG